MGTRDEDRRAESDHLRSLRTAQLPRCTLRGARCMERQRKAWLAKRASLQRFAPTLRVLNERRTLHVSRWKLGPRTLHGVLRCLVHARVQGRHCTCARFTETAANVLALIRPALSHACQTAHAGKHRCGDRVAASSGPAAVASESTSRGLAIGGAIATSRDEWGVRRRRFAR